MISFDFEYFKPETFEEAVSIYQQMEANGKAPLYYSGGLRSFPWRAWISFSQVR